MPAKLIRTPRRYPACFVQLPWADTVAHCETCGEPISTAQVTVVPVAVVVVLGEAGA